MPYFICPNCKRRSIDHDRREGLTHQAVRLPELRLRVPLRADGRLLPGPAAGFVVCDSDRRILAAGRGVFELTGFSESELLGQLVDEAFGLNGGEGPSPAEVAVEWGVRQMGQSARADHEGRDAQVGERGLLPRLRRRRRPARCARPAASAGYACRPLLARLEKPRLDPRLQGTSSAWRSSLEVVRFTT